MVRVLYQRYDQWTAAQVEDKIIVHTGFPVNDRPVIVIEEAPEPILIKPKKHHRK